MAIEMELLHRALGRLKARCAAWRAGGPAGRGQLGKGSPAAAPPERGPGRAAPAPGSSVAAWPKALPAREALFSELERHGVKMVVARFDGRDGGSRISATSYVASAEPGRLEVDRESPFKRISVGAPGGPVRAGIEETAIALCTSILDAGWPGWEAHAGSFGTLHLLVEGRAAELDFNERYITIENQKRNF